MINFKTFCEESPPTSDDNGTYVAVLPSPESADDLQRWLNAGLISEDIKQAPDFHCTIVYSKVNIPSAAPIGGMDIFCEAFPTGLDNFNDNLVLKLNFPAGNRLNHTFHKAGAQEDFPTYQPHITLISKLQEWRDGGGNLDNLDVNKAPKRILFTRILVEPLSTRDVTRNIRIDKEYHKT